MAFEIERKYLLNELPETLDRETGIPIKQGYLCFENDREVRIRQMGGSCYITYKKGTGLIRHEVEFEVNRKIFQELWPQTEGRQLEKIRYYF